MPLTSIRVIDSHTEGEPTRVVIDGGPDLGPGSPAERLKVFRERFDHFRSAVCNEPRGSDALVGALLLPPVSPRAAAGVIFFNNVGFLNMCVHGTIGLGVTLARLGRIAPGDNIIETPVGDVTLTLHPPEAQAGSDAGPDALPARVSVANVPSFRYRARVPLRLDSGRTVHGDVAWGGNWFFLVDDHNQRLAADDVEQLTAFAWSIRQALVAAGVRADPSLGGGDIDHIELFGPPSRDDCHSRNFVLCPGKAYDRSPCGTGTSAKLACLHADGELRPGEIWRQESIIGSAFEGTVREAAAASSDTFPGRPPVSSPDNTPRVIPTITGTAYITAEATLLLDPADRFRWGIGVGVGRGPSP